MQTLQPLKVPWLEPFSYVESHAQALELDAKV